MTTAVRTVPPVPFARAFRDHPTALIVFFTFAPIIAISALGWYYAEILRNVVPVELTSLDALSVMVAGMMHFSVRADSWGPMLQGLNVARGPQRDALYQILFFSGHVRFQYPPTSLLPIDLLSAGGLAGFRTLNAINSVVYLLNTGAAGLLAWLLFREPARAAGGSGSAPRRGAVVVTAIIAAFVFYPNVRADILGQIQVWIDLLFTCAIIAWLCERRLVAGILIGLACTIKPQFGLLLLWAVVWREWRFSVGFLAAFLPVTVVSVVRYGLAAHFGYLQVLTFLSRHGESFFANNSVNGILNGYYASTGNLHWDAVEFAPYHFLVYAGTLTVSVLVLALLLFAPLTSRGNRPTTTDFATASICTVVSSPVAWEHHYGILLPIYIVALKYLLDQPPGVRRRIAFVCLTISWILVANFIPFANLLAGTAFSALQAYVFLGAILVLIVLRGDRPADRGSYESAPAAGGRGVR
jgi:alpha-1,2-mannosyltransferase